MKKRIFALALALCLMLSLVPTMAFAEGDECNCETACTEGNMNSGCPICGAEGATPESCAKKATTGTESEDAVKKVQALIDALPESVTVDNLATVKPQLAAIDAAMKKLTEEQKAQLNLDKYKNANNDIEKLNDPTGSAPQPETKTPEETLREGINAAEFGAIVTLTESVTLTKPLEIKRGITLDLAGHDIKLGEDMESAIQLGEGVSISVTNSSSATPGTIYGTNEMKATDWNDTVEDPIGVCAVTFKKEDGKIYATRYVQSGHTVTGFSELEKPGYTLTWTQQVWVDEGTDEDGNKVDGHYDTETYDFSVPVIKNIVLTANYEPIAYTITFDPNGGAGTMAPQSMTYDKEEALNKNTFTRDGYDFNGWTTGKDGTGILYADQASVKNLTTRAGDNITLYAQWKAKEVTPATVTVTFDANGGKLTGDASATVNKGGKLEKLPAEPTRTGYTFGGWYTEKDGGDKVTTDTAFDKDTTLYAHWTANTYTVVFVNGTEKKTQEMTYDVEAKLNANTFTKDGYTFADWNTQEDGKGKTYTDGQAVSNLTAEQGGKVSLYAQWVKDTETKPTAVTKVTFSQKGYEYGEKVKELEVTSGTTGITFPDGLKFGGAYGINKSKSLTAANEVTYGTFKSETQYYLYVKFEAAEGYTLDGLEAENVKLDGEKAVKLTVKDETATAVFKLPKIFLIKATAGSNGKIEPSGTVAVFEGESVTFKITPNTGYGISTMKIDDKSQTTKKEYEFKNVDDSHTIKVTFAKSNGSAKTGDDLRLIWLAGAGVLSLAALVAIVIIHNKKKKSK